MARKQRTTRRPGTRPPRDTGQLFQSVGTGAVYGPSPPRAAYDEWVRLQAVRDGLANAGIVLPPDVSRENLLDAVCAASKQQPPPAPLTDANANALLDALAADLDVERVGILADRLEDIGDARAGKVRGMKVEIYPLLQLVYKNRVHERYDHAPPGRQAAEGPFYFFIACIVWVVKCLHGAKEPKDIAGVVADARRNLCRAALALFPPHVKECRIRQDQDPTNRLIHAEMRKAGLDPRKPYQSHEDKKKKWWILTQDVRANQP